MTVTVKTKVGSGVFEVHLSGTLTARDYQTFVPDFERQLQAGGNLRLLIDMEGFRGWSPGGLWEDLKFDVKHYHDIDRIALVGDKKWEKAMGVLIKPFTAAEVRLFPRAQIDAARAWLAPAQAGKP